MAEPLIRRAGFAPAGAAGAGAKAVIEALRDRGHTAYVAGGAVRDHLLGVAPKDYDVATSAPPEEVLRTFRRTQKVGLAFGVVLVRDFGPPTEVATFRSDGAYLDGRRPESVTFGDAAADAARRDFTVNGLYYCPVEDTVIDYVGGLADLDNRVLRAIGDPRQRFGEDHLRLLRAVRFSLRLGFPIEEGTWAAVQEMAPRIARIAPDRIHGELGLIFALGKGDEAAGMLISAGLLEPVFGCPAPAVFRPGPAHTEGGTLAAASALVLGRLPEEVADATMERLRFTKAERRTATRLLSVARVAGSYPAADTPWRKRLLRESDRREVLWLLSRGGLDPGVLAAMEADLGRWGRAELAPPPPLPPAELLRLGVPAGPALGSCLRFLEDLSLEEGGIGADAALDALRAHPEFGPLLGPISGPAGRPD